MQSALAGAQLQGCRSTCSWAARWLSLTLLLEMAALWEGRSGQALRLAAATQHSSSAFRHADRKITSNALGAIATHG